MDITKRGGISYPNNVVIGIALILSSAVHSFEEKREPGLISICMTRLLQD
jgi:hypothetical protein|nr:MAG TPA: hypothetical protein [Caudoviricetes sp.]